MFISIFFILLNLHQDNENQRLLLDTLREVYQLGNDFKFQEVEANIDKLFQRKFIHPFGDDFTGKFLFETKKNILSLKKLPENKLKIIFNEID